MRRSIGEYHIKIASDIVRDGLGIELWDKNENLVAEIFRCDTEHTIILRTFDHNVSLQVIETFIKFARERLDLFEDGTNLPKSQPITIQDLGEQF